MAKFTNNGLEIDGLSDIRQRLIDKANLRFSPLLAGQTLSTDDSGVIGRFLSILSEELSLHEEVLQSVVSSIDINQASGLALDKLVELGGLYRLPASPATTNLMLYGNIGTTVSSGASARSTKTGDIFYTDDPVTFNTNNAVGVEVELTVNGSVQEYTINYSVNSKFSQNAPITVFSLTTDDKNSLAKRISQTVNSQTSDLIATVTTEDNVIIKSENNVDQSVWSVTGSLNIIRSYHLVAATSATSGTVAQDANTITSINSGSVIGWLGVTNPFSSDASLPVETDEQLRYRFRLNKGYDQYGNYAAMYASLVSVIGVQFINIQQNITSVSNGSRTNQGISIVVLGGNGQEIANAIFKNLPIGTVTDGTEIYYVTDINGGQHEVRFSRPSFVPIKISMSLKALPNFPTSGKNQIKQAIVDWFNDLDVGEDIYYSRLFEPINSIQGFTVKNLKVAKLNGGVLGTDDITIKYNELATITPADILIGE